ncbi:MAG TPA: hypothetical protein VM452_13185 [Caulifigura sp.]|nr:hypothetical protein [Caulifigura sp.]
MKAAKLLWVRSGWALLLLAAMNSPLSATIININFSGDTVGLAPHTEYPAGPTVSHPSAIGSYGAPAGTVLVGNAPGMSQGAILSSDGANADLGAAWLDVTGFSLPGDTQSMSFDVNVLAAPAHATSQPKVLDGGPSEGILLGMNVHTTNGWAFRFAAMPTSEGGGIFGFRSPDNSAVTSFFNYLEGVTYTVRIDSDFSTGLLDAYINGNKLLSGFAFWTSGAANVSTNEYFFHLNGEAGFNNSVAIDNINAATTPEPSSIALLAMAVGAIPAFRRRKAAGIAAAAPCEA